MDERDTLRIAAVADIHVKKTSQGAFQALFAAATESADVLLLCGDLTDHGLPGEAFGPAIIKAIKGPLPQAPLMPTGGVDLSNGMLRSAATAAGRQKATPGPSPRLTRIRCVAMS